eukprot:scaffold9729_cov108-Isochrysis_galbana.AAC.9
MDGLPACEWLTRRSARSRSTGGGRGKGNMSNRLRLGNGTRGDPSRLCPLGLWATPASGGPPYDILRSAKDVS